MKSFLREAIPPKRNRGFSFFELMVAVVILGGGLVLIYKAFFLVLTYTNHLTYRLEAEILLDHKIASLSSQLQDHNELALTHSTETDRVFIANKAVDYIYSFEIKNVDGLNGLFQLDISISWQEGARRVRLIRSLYISNYILNGITRRDLSSSEYKLAV